MLYIVQRGDSLSSIAARFETTVSAILAINVICNPNLILIGQPLLIPQQGLDFPKAGGSPYYILQFGDTLWCLAIQFSQSIPSLVASNQIQNPNQVFVGQELLVGFDQPDPDELFTSWNEMGGVSCDELSSLQMHGIYYIGSFQWEALGARAVPYLQRLLTHSCPFVRTSAVLSLGRIGTGISTRLALQQALQDSDPSVVELANLALKRMKLIPTMTKRIHIATNNLLLFTQPNLQSTHTTIPTSTPLIVHRWRIPSPTFEEGPRGDIQIYDYVQIPATGQIGFVPRAGFNAIQMI